MSHTHRPLALIILDGWGYSEEAQHNAIMAANTPVWDQLWHTYAHTLITASGADVGLPGEQMGNSEVGHLNIGAGRVVYQEFTRINRAISSGSFFSNQTLTKVVDDVVRNNKALHILGLLSDGGVHSHDSHFHAMVKLAAERGVNNLYLHAFLDGRDTPPKSALSYISAMQACFNAVGKGRFASIIGRFYAMDRDQRWERVQQAYDLIAHGKSLFHAHNPLEAVENAYARNETDEFVQATRIGAAVPIEQGDSIVFMNFRADRARELCQCFIDPQFSAFQRVPPPRLAQFVTLTEYKKEFTAPVAFPAETHNNLFGERIAAVGLKQLRIAETEKYAHVTFFFNGGRDTPYEGEDRILVPSPKVTTYDLQPEMSAPEVADRLVKAIHSHQYDVIICNFANADMVGHTGNFAATVKAIETLDNCLGRIWAALKESGGEMLITADHGNAEKMTDPDKGQPHTAHTSNLVPFIYAGRPASCTRQGNLSNIAPTMLHLLGLPIPAEMNNDLLVTLL